MKKALIFLIVLMLIGGGAAAYFILFNNDSEAPQEIRTPYIPGEYFVTNVRRSGPDDYTTALVKVSVVLEVDEKPENTEFFAFLDEKQYIIRNKIVFILRDKTEEELRANDVQDVLADEMMKELNQTLGIENIRGVYFTDYVVQ
ncbi:MAG: flagellar basal body-associated FliL family protein [Christensenellales bacterium]|jgi:flagellar FliL protein